ncbi:MAG: DUF5606 domain-containing protein [Bacteroidales bacterium]
MDLSKILSISGKPGLYKVLAQTKNGAVVESIPDGKKFTAFSHQRISTLEEISIFAEGEDLPLKEVLKVIYKKLNGQPALSHKSDGAALKTFFEEAVPNYDKENVYVSDIKKVIHWYNILLEQNLLDFTDEASEEIAGEESKPETSGEVADKATTDQTEKNG